MLGSTASLILNLSTRWRWAVSLTHRPLYSPRKNTRHPLNMGLGGSHSHGGLESWITNNSSRYVYWSSRHICEGGHTSLTTNCKACVTLNVDRTGRWGWWDSVTLLQGPVLLLLRQWRFASAPHSQQGAGLRLFLPSTPSDNNITRCCASPSFSQQVRPLNLKARVRLREKLVYKRQIFWAEWTSVKWP